MPFTVYHAAPGLLAELTAELGDAVTAVRDPLVVADGPPRQAAFAANVWTAPEFLQATSIGQAAKALTDGRTSKTTKSLAGSVLTQKGKR